MQVLARRLRLEGDFDFAQIAVKTPGFVGADLTALIKEAAAIAVMRIFSELQALEQVQVCTGALYCCRSLDENGILVPWTLMPLIFCSVQWRSRLLWIPHTMEALHDRNL
jgi:SpoVK/Ycf46/Vps4 family AAA+-type ATPase